jgi:hypothetical protein
MDMMPILPETELEAAAAQHLGRLLFVFGRLELNLGMALVRMRPAPSYADAILRVEKLGFLDKLDEFEAAALRRHAGDQEALARWHTWFAQAQALRKLKSDFAHGRWGFQNMQQRLVHVSNLPGSPHQDEVRYTLDEFAAHVAGAEEVAEAFCLLTDMYPLDACHETVTQES